MQNRETQQINEFELKTIMETSTLFLNIRKPHKNRLSNGSKREKAGLAQVMELLSTSLTRIPSRLHRPTKSSIGRGNLYGRDAASFSSCHRDPTEKTALERPVW